MKGIPTRKLLLQTLENFFYLQHEVNHIFVNKPTFAKYLEADEIYHKMMKIKIPDEETSEKWCDLLWRVKEHTGERTHKWKKETDERNKHVTPIKESGPDIIQLEGVTVFLHKDLLFS